uniref:UBX domain-containing protein 11 n=1 Tax=Athene cunicularia TaxID=194338 RepID=A0A663LR78_ATHCN
MSNGPFWPYQEPPAQQCLQDIVDGYFPSELQLRYPDGVPLQVSSAKPYSSAFQKEEIALLLPKKIVQVSFTNLLDAPHSPKLSLEQFLNKLSKPLTHRGEAISVRGSARAALCHRQSARSSADKVFPTSRVKTAEEAESSAPDVCTLRIKSESGEQTYVIKMLFTETIGDLRQHLAHIRGGDSDWYEIISTFPQRVYADNSRSLQECGLIPNASLLLRRRDPSQRQGQGPQLQRGPGSQPRRAASLPPPPPSPACCSQDLDAATGHRVIGEERNPFAASQLNPE